ncbi:MAG: hypothetical protein INR71_12205, partial [Terriglobus roseus]|nr:hypothetical protein [Terriglobus roseus]
MIAEKRGEFSAAEAQYRKAWDMARSATSELGDEPLLYTTGIAAHLGRMLESRWRLKDAAKVYAQAFREIQEDEDASPRERVRAAALAVRYGVLAKDVETLEWAVAELLRLANVPTPEERSTLDQTNIEVGKLKLPSFVTNVDLGAAFEQLGLLYLEKDEHECVTTARCPRGLLTLGRLAVPALLQALSTLSPASADLPARCRSALLMNALASANQSDTASAKQWATKSIDVARDTQADGKRANKRRSTGECRECEVADGAV